MIKVGYFSDTNVQKSETFIYDLLMALNCEKQIDLIFISGQSQPDDKLRQVKAINAGFADKGAKIGHIALRIGNLKERGYDLQLKVRKSIAAKALKRASIEQLDIAYIEYATTATLINEDFIKRNIPYIVHVHGYDITSMLKNRAYKKNLINVLGNAAYIVAASHYIRRLLILFGCRHEKVKVIRLAVDAQSIVPMPWEKRLEHDPSVLFLGRLTPKKHPIALLHAFRLVVDEIPNAMLTIIGDGELWQDVAQRVKILKLENNVAMLGALSREEAFPIMNRHWVYAQHSVTAVSGDVEGFCISLAEAAVHGLPVVSTLHNGIPENVVDGKTGLLVREFDYEAMSEKLIYLLKNPDAAEKMGKAGREHIIALCQPEKRKRKILELIVGTANKHKK